MNEADPIHESSSQLGGYLQGEMAEVFGQSLAQVIADDPTDDSVDEFIANFDAFMTQPVRLH